MLYIERTTVGSPYTGVFWFLQGIIAVYLVYPLLNQLYNNNFKLFAGFTGLLVIQKVLNNLIQMYLEVRQIAPDADYYAAAMKDWLLRFEVVPATLQNGEYLLFFMLGGVFMHYLKQIQAHKKFIFITGILAWILAAIYGIWQSKRQGTIYNPAYNYCSIFTFFILPGWLALLQNYKDHKNFFNKLVTNIGKHTMGIYTIHILVMTIIRYNFALKLETMGPRVIFTLVVFSISWLLSNVLDKIPLVNKLVRLS